MFIVILLNKTNINKGPNDVEKGIRPPFCGHGGVEYTPACSKYIIWNRLQIIHFN